MERSTRSTFVLGSFTSARVLARHVGLTSKREVNRGGDRGTPEGVEDRRGVEMRGGGDGGV